MWTVPIYKRQGHVRLCDASARQSDHLLSDHEAKASVSAHAMTMNRLSCSQRSRNHELLDAIPAQCKAMDAALANNKFTFALDTNVEIEVFVAISTTHVHLLLLDVFRQSCAHDRTK